MIDAGALAADDLVARPERFGVLRPAVLLGRVAAPQERLGGAAHDPLEARAGDVGEAGAVAHHRGVGPEEVGGPTGTDVDGGAGGQDPFEPDPAGEGVEEARGHVPPPLPLLFFSRPRSTYFR